MDSLISDCISLSFLSGISNLNNYNEKKIKEIPDYNKINKIINLNNDLEINLSSHEDYKIFNNSDITREKKIEKFNLLYN